MYCTVHYVQYANKMLFQSFGDNLYKVFKDVYILQCIYIYGCKMK